MTDKKPEPQKNWNLESLEDGRMVLNMGPSHPAMHGIVRVLLTVQGERVAASDVEIGYLHRGFEKTCENVTYNQCVPYTDRLNYVSPFINNVGFALAVEKLMGIETPARCQYIRVIMSELSRLTDHLTCIGANAMELSAFTVYFYLINAREALYKLTDSAAGGRITPAYTRVGGLTRDLPPDFKKNAAETLKIVRRNLADAGALLTRNRIFYDRLHNTGHISKEDAIALSFTGPALRSTGVPLDVRKATPYLVYDRFDFDIPVGSNGDNYDRYLVRMEEMQQSIRIVEQALAQLPDGPVNHPDFGVSLPPKKEVYENIEALMAHFKLTFEGVKPPKGEVYQAVEGGNGEVGFYLVSDGTGKPWRLRVRPPCFSLTGGLSQMIQGGYIADIVSTFGQINMIGGELER
ncbi:MAG: NADH dehydrogenase (quinone) subunit D [Elusimicrobia bacterium GWD2_63_28]|nr:MAG: NADH dehydrogenase (quinone) subunit D [Elusimicrobia bacterium GWD2_63_28]